VLPGRVRSAVAGGLGRIEDGGVLSDKGGVYNGAGEAGGLYPPLEDR
jgi:hypothetical protein